MLLPRRTPRGMFPNCGSRSGGSGSTLGSKATVGSPPLGTWTVTRPSAVSRSSLSRAMPEPISSKMITARDRPRARAGHGGSRRRGERSQARGGGEPSRGRGARALGAMRCPRSARARGRGDGRERSQRIVRHAHPRSQPTRPCRGDRDREPRRRTDSLRDRVVLDGEVRRDAGLGLECGSACVRACRHGRGRRAARRRRPPAREAAPFRRHPAVKPSALHSQAPGTWICVFGLKRGRLQVEGVTCQSTVDYGIGWVGDWASSFQVREGSNF
jgi:hypothetical protein